MASSLLALETLPMVMTYNYEYIIGDVLGFDPVDLEGRSTMIVK